MGFLCPSKRLREFLPAFLFIQPAAPAGLYDVYLMVSGRFRPKFISRSHPLHSENARVRPSTGPGFGFLPRLTTGERSMQSDGIIDRCVAQSPLPDLQAQAERPNNLRSSGNRRSQACLHMQPTNSLPSLHIAKPKQRNVSIAALSPESKARSRALRQPFRV